MREVLQVTALPDFEPEIGRWLWAMEETRSGTLATVRSLSQHVLDWEGPAAEENAIGSLLYHIALIEMAWLFEDILEQEVPATVQADYPYHVVDGRGRLTRVLSVPLTEHVQRLERSRAIFLEAMRGVSLKEWRQLRSPKDMGYQVTPEWAVFHLVEHEAGHLFQIRAMKAQTTRFVAAVEKGAVE